MYGCRKRKRKISQEAALYPKGRIRRRRTRGRMMIRRRRARLPRKIGMPGMSRIVKFRFVQFTSLNPGTTNIVSQPFRCNDIFTPDATGGTNQSMGFDQWAQFYSRWMVIGSKIRVKCASHVSGTGPTVWGILKQETATPTATLASHIIEQGTSPWRIQQNVTNGNTTTLTNTWSLRKWYQLKDPRDNMDNTYAGAFAGTSPSRIPYYILWASSVQGNDVDTLQYIVQIDYIAIVFDPIEMAAS